MPAYLVEVYRHPSHESAEHAERMCAPSYGAETKDTEIHDTPPVVLAGLVRGGEFSGLTEWFVNATRDMLCLAADGRVVNGWDHAKYAEARGALPFTWYTYPEEG